MFQQVVAYVETKPLPRGGNIRRADEARAAVAVCLRWSSYFAVLADPSRPDAPYIQDEQVSQIDDEEMARMNVEISAAIAWWFSLCGSNDRRYWDLVHRALQKVRFSGEEKKVVLQDLAAKANVSLFFLQPPSTRAWPPAVVQGL